MKKKVVSLVLLLVGAGLWLVLANTARVSIKKWDAKFETVLRHKLSDLGLSDRNLLNSVHKVSQDADGEWVTHFLSISVPDKGMVDKLEDALKSSGGNVRRLKKNDGVVLIVERGSRVYQEIAVQVQPS